MTAKKATKKTAPAKTVHIKDKKTGKLKGSVSLGGKKAPVAKKAVPKPSGNSMKKALAKKTVVKKAVAVKKSSTPQMMEIDKALNDEFIKDITPFHKGVKINFTVGNFEELNTRRGVSWTADIFRDGVKVGTAENRGDGGANYYYFDDREVRTVWEDTAKKAYADTSHEDDDEEDTLFSWLDHLSGQ